MDFVTEWPETAKDVLMQPSTFFEEEDRREGFGFPIKFAAVSFLIAGIISAVGSIAAGGIGVGALISSVVGGLIGLIIGAAIIHIFVALLGGDSGYSNTLGVFGYATAISPISAALSLLSLAGLGGVSGVGVGSLAGLIVSLYGLYIQIRGLEAFQGLSTGRAALAVLLPLIIIGILAVILIVIAGAAFLSAMGTGALGA